VGWGEFIEFVVDYGFGYEDWDVFVVVVYGDCGVIFGSV